VVDVFIPDPWRHFAFVTFAEQRVAASLIGKEHNLKVRCRYRVVTDNS
jgi:hypothetical protein